MNQINKYFSTSFFGESHAKVMGFSVENIPAGMEIDFDEISKLLALRRGNDLSTKRKENDRFEIVSGFFNGYTTGQTLTVLVYNQDYDSKDYQNESFRPSTADYTAFKKYQGFNNYQGGGIFSGRITVLYVILGAILKMVINDYDLLVSSHIKNVYNIYDDSFDLVIEEKDLMKSLNEMTLPLIDDNNEVLIRQLLKNSNHNYGSSVETKIIGLNDLFLGEPNALGFESVISSLIFMIPGVKALEFGIGLDYQKSDTKVNDVYLKTNNEGGINGGITNGLPVVFTTTFRPIPSTSLVQEHLTKNNEYVEKNTVGRHDKVIALRAFSIINAVSYIALAECLGLGGYLGKVK